MDWDTLLIDQRFRKSGSRSQNDFRNEFENDFSRIVFSSSFRRLQDKTQVFPCDPNDFVRTRLTHSIEVSSLGRSIGLSLDKLLENKGYIDNTKHHGKISSILATAGLIHDLGNPPFGHHGEVAFKKFYEKLFSIMDSSKKIQILNKQEIADLENFDGNVQTFRILKRLQYLKDEHSFNLSFPVLATIIKYPKSSIMGNKKDDNVCNKKYGYFYTEEEFFRTIWDKLEIKDASGSDTRHPLTFLLEAADDIAYSIADVEDGSKKGIIDFEEFVSELDMNLDKSNSVNNELLDSAHQILDTVDQEYVGWKDASIQRLRIVAQGIMINAILKEFIDNHEKIMTGEYKKELLSQSEASEIREEFSKIANKIFNNKLILKQEVIGDRVISFLLEKFVDAALSENRNNTKTHEGKVYSLISDNYKFIKKKYPSTKNNDHLFNRLLLVNDYISGMTDNYALRLYKELNGIV